MTIIAMRRSASNAEFDAALVERLERAHTVADLPRSCSQKTDARAVTAPVVLG